MRISKCWKAKGGNSARNQSFEPWFFVESLEWRRGLVNILYSKTKVKKIFKGIRILMQYCFSPGASKL
ncbi:hypothetical protein L2E82_12705 [Cichorium intybus]|uniref:Uncharacterized protein n=1 Tax=Cichorium intybus TaxID=13427 RepID=A0ACB9GIT0_CICIN|nr:hypothetical protein L2E82_12705 [Cichorium intybus]